MILAPIRLSDGAAPCVEYRPPVTDAECESWYGELCRHLIVGNITEAELWLLMLVIVHPGVSVLRLAEGHDIEPDRIIATVQYAAELGVFVFGQRSDDHFGPHDLTPWVR